MIEITFDRQQRRILQQTIDRANRELERVTSKQVFGNVLSQFGRPGRAHLKRITPRGTRRDLVNRREFSLQNNLNESRVRLYRAVSMRTSKFRDGNIVLFLGWGRRNSGIRFQQRLAVEYGTRFVEGGHYVGEAGAIINRGVNADKLMEFVARRIDMLIFNQNRRALAAARNSRRR